MLLTNQICIIFAAVRGYLDNIPVNEVSEFEDFFYTQISETSLLNSAITNLLQNFNESTLHYICSLLFTQWKKK